MKNIKNIAKIFVCMAISITGWGCDETPNEEQSRIEVVNSKALNQELFAEQKEATSVVFVTTGAWTSTITEGASSWIVFTPEKGDASKQYTVSINLKTNATGNDRTAVFTIRCGNEEVGITITQKAVDSEGNLWIEIPVEQSKILVVNSAALNQVLLANQREATSIIFVTADAWTSTLTEGADWITFDPAQGATFGRYTVSISLAVNTVSQDRTAVFTIRCGDEERDITITQKAGDGDPYEDEDIEDYFNRDWDILQRARTQALAENRDPLSPPAIQKILFVACTNTTIGANRYVMDDRQKQFVKDVAKNFKEVVDYYSNNNVEIHTEILFIDREIDIPNVSPTYLTQASIQPELDISAPVGTYDGILVTAATGVSSVSSVHLGVKTAGYENLYGYAWFKLYVTTGSSLPPTSYPYTIPAANEAPFYSTDIAVHEWMHQLEFLGGLLNYTFPPVHAYQGPDQGFTGYIPYPYNPVWDFAAYYRDLLSGKVKYTSEGITYNTGMFPLMWRITPRFLNSKAIYIINEANGMYLTYSGTITSFSITPSPWYLRYTGDNKYLILTNDNRTLDISNAWNTEGNAVNIYGVNGGYPQAQNWRFSQNIDGTYKITTTFPSNNKVLQRNTGVTYPTGTTINADNNSLDQKWRLINKPL